MPDRREHYISAAYAEKKPPDLTFSTLVRTSKADFLKRIVVNDEPPPRREVVLVISVTNYKQVQESPLERVFGFVFEDELCLSNFNLSPNFMTSLKALLKRVQRENQSLKHYGLSVRLFVNKGSIEELNDIYGNMNDLCLEAEEKEVNIDFDILQDRQELQVFLKGALRRITHGDKMAAYEALSP